MKKRKYSYMIVSNETEIMIGMEYGANTNNHYRISNRLLWGQVEDAQIDLIETQLDIMEANLDRAIEPKPPTTFEDIFGPRP